MRTRRLGTLTLGASLVIFGVLFLISKISGAITYELIFTLWPCILILLGIEIIATYIINKDTVMKYDGVSIFLLIALSFFSIAMVGADFLLHHATELYHISI